jgi:hypothetical protein
MRNGLTAVVLLIVGLIIYFNVTIFVVQPIGAVPEGKTLVIARRGALQFVDSADAICARTQGGVSLLCRGLALAEVSKSSTIFLRLPYSELLYVYSTGGKTYSK